MHEAGSYLAVRFAAFDKAGDADDVRAIAKELFIRLRLAILAGEGAEPLEMGTLVESMGGGDTLFS